MLPLFASTLSLSSASRATIGTHPARVFGFVQRHTPFTLLLGVAAALRLYGLGWLPSPAGDEGNWVWIAYRLSRGTDARLDADASFVSLLHARLMAATMRALGPSFFAARLVGVCGTLLAVVTAYAACVALGSRRAGLACAGVLAVHPWALLWSRTAAVPYALALTVMVVGPLLIVYGARTHRALAVALGIQVVALGAQFSPLTFIAPVACLVFLTVRPHRWTLRHWLTYASTLLAAMHALPVIRAATRVASAARHRDHFEHFGTRLVSFVHMVTTGLAGEATLRHFTDSAMAPGTAWILALPLGAVVVLAAGRAARTTSVTAGFGPLYLTTGLLMMPLLLAPGREWHLARIDTERYLFALLPGFALCVADLASASRTTSRALAGAAFAWLLIGSTGRAAWAFLRGGGPDRGVLIAQGGAAYRGWRVTREHAATVELVRDEAQRRAGPGGATILIADWAFHPIHFALEGSGLRGFDVRAGPLPLREDGRYFFLLWSEGLFAPGFAPPEAPMTNAALRAKMHAYFRNVRLVRRFVQPDGSPLFELWQGDRPMRAH